MCVSVCVCMCVSYISLLAIQHQPDSSISLLTTTHNPIFVAVEILQDYKTHKSRNH